MKKNSKILTLTSFLLFGLFIILTNTAFGQTDTQTKIDSLNNLLKSTNADTARIKILNVLFLEYEFLNREKALHHITKAYKLAEKSSYKKGMIESLLYLSYYYGYSDYPKALSYSLKGLRIAEDSGDESGKLTMLHNTGNLYYQRENFKKAIAYYLEALKIAEFKSLKGKKANLLNNIGSAYMALSNFDEALNYFQQSLKLYQELNIKEKIALVQVNTGKIYYIKGNPDKALEYYVNAFKIPELKMNHNAYSSALAFAGDAYNEKKQYANALHHYQQALRTAKEAGINSLVKDIYKSISQLYVYQENYRKAYEYHVLHKQLADSLLNESSSRQIAEMQTKYDTEKKEQQIALLNKEKQKDRIMRTALGAGVLMLLMVAGLMLNRYRLKQRANKKLEEKNREIEHQKTLVEEKNKDIIDSIRYAKRIQEAILPSMTAMQQALKDGFVLYKPKDVVAGDFYWLELHDGKVYFAAADCTGHGVPGAMVSVICSNALSKALLEEKAGSTGELLDKTREIVINRLAKSGEEVKDGMDISLCAIDFSTGQLQWSGANNPLWIIRNGELIECKHDKQAIGVQDNARPFTTHNIELQKNDRLYIITDGYQDQFGGPKGKKFRPSQLKEKLLSIQNQNMNDQKITLDTEFENWKGQNEQIDDVCIIGVRIS